MNIRSKLAITNSTIPDLMNRTPSLVGLHGRNRRFTTLDLPLMIWIKVINLGRSSEVNLDVVIGMYYI